MPTRPIALPHRLLPLPCVAAARTTERRGHLPHALLPPHVTMLPLPLRYRLALTCRCTMLCLWSAQALCVQGQTTVAMPLWHYGAWATPTSSTCRRLAPTMGCTGCASRIAPRCTRQLPTTSSLPPVLLFLPCPPLCARPPLFPPSRRGHGEPGCRHLPSISRAHVCALMSACQPSPAHLKSSHDELPFGSSPSVVPLRLGPAVAEGTHTLLHPSSIHLYH